MQLQVNSNNRFFEINAVKGMWLAFVFCTFLYHADAQTWNMKAPDSLIYAVKNSTGNKKVDALNKLAKQVILFSTSGAIPVVKDALQLSKELHYSKGEANAIENLAVLIFKRGDYQKAIKLMDNAAQIYKKSKYSEEYINCLIVKAGYYEFTNDKENITDTYLEAVNNAKMIGAYDLESRAESYLGMYSLKIGDKAGAIAYLLKALNNSKKSNSNVAYGHATYGLALYYGSEKQYGKAMNYFRIALKEELIANEILSKKAIYARIGDLFLESKLNDSAFIYYQKSLVLALNNKDLGSVATIYTRIAHIFELEQKLDSALKYQEIALDLRRIQGNLTLTGSSLTNIGTVYAKKHEYTKALDYYNQGLAIAKESGYLNYIQFSYQRLFNLYLSQNNYKKAIDYNLLLSAINDSILKTETRLKFSRIQARYENDQKQKAIEFLTKENDIQKLKINQTRFMIYILATLLILLIVLGVLLNMQAKLNARHRQMDSEQKLLRSQMNPHFIFNALVSIQGFIYNNESDVAAKYLTRFARLIRLVLSNSREESVSLRREIDMLENYLALQKMRFENKFDYSFIVDPALDPEFISIPPMLAQPFLERAIEQGISGMNKPGFIEISIIEKDNNILIQVKDNGNNKDNNITLQSKSIDPDKSDALRITKERIRHLNHKRASKITFIINEVKDEYDQYSGTIALLVIPEKLFN